MNADAIRDTAIFSVPGGVDPQRLLYALPTVEIDLAAVSDRGKVRANNEDHYLVSRFGRFLDCLATNLPPGSLPIRFEQAGYGLMVADGMGGQAAGEIASRLATTTYLQLVLETPDWILTHDESHMEEVERRQSERLQKVDDALVNQGRADPALAGMGTTLTLAVSLGQDLLVVHIGDSRAYLYRAGRLIRLTRDHTVAQSMADAGYIPIQDISKNRMRHMLTNALGGNCPVQAEFTRVQLRDGDRLLVCTDGLTDKVDDATIADVLALNKESNAACRELLNLALHSGGHDNITVVVARYAISSTA